MLCQQPSDRISASILVSSLISHTHHNTPPERAGATLGIGKDHATKSVIPLQCTASYMRERRVSFEGIEHQRFKQLLPSNTEGTIQGSYPPRRIVSDPIILRMNHRTDGHPFLKKSALMEPDVKKVSEKTVGNPSKDVKAQGNVEKLPFIDISCLKPQSVKCKEIFVSVLKNKHVLVELSDVSKNELGIKAMIIDTLQDQIKLYGDLLSEDHLRHNPLKGEYTRESLPADLRRFYQLASGAIGQMRKRTPKGVKLVVYTSDGKFSLMMNGPPGDVEVSLSQFAPFSACDTWSTDRDESILRVRYSRDEGLIEFRRFVGGQDGKFWTRKCMMSVFNPAEISQTEWARLDSTEKAGLERLIQFSEASKTMDLDTNFSAQRLSAPSYAGIGKHG